MSTKESKLWKKINQLQKGRKDWHLTRIESSTINGIPDVFGCIKGRSFWLELKATDVKNCGLSKFQINWHLNHKKNGGVSYILQETLTQPKLKLLEVREPRSLDPVAEGENSRLTLLLHFDKMLWDNGFENKNLPLNS